MALAVFRLRSPSRDAEIDRVRFDRLGDQLESVRSEIVREAAGLRQRHADVVLSAASAQAAYENEGGAEISAKVDDLTRSLIQHSSRIAALEAQLGFLAGVGQHVAGFRNGLAGEAD